MFCHGAVLTSPDVLSRLPRATPRVKVKTLRANMHPGNLTSMDSDAKLPYSLFTVTGYDWFNKTSMVFHTARGDTIHLINGKAFVRKMNGVNQPICR
jgi:hypothetical protein